MRKIFSIILLSINAFAIKIALLPQEIKIEVFPGATRGFSFILSNYGKHGAGNCKVSVQDLDITPDGEVVFFPGGSLSYSCAQWINFPISSFLIEPGSSKKISGYVTVPRDKNISGSYEGVILCTFLPPDLPTKEKIAGVGINLQLPLRIEVKVGRAKEKLKIANIEFSPKEKHFVIRLDNEGEASVLTQKGNLLIKRKGSIVETLPLVSKRYTLLRSSSRIFTGEFKNRLQEGKYELEAIIEYNEKYRVIGKERIFVDKDGKIAFLKEGEKEEKGIFFEINPVFLFLSLSCDRFTTGIIKLSNKEQEPILVFMELKNTSYTKGEFQLLPTSSQTTYSIIPFIELFPTSLRLAPQQSGIIRYKAMVPKGNKGEKYGALFFSLATLYGKKKDTFTLPLGLSILNTEERNIKIDNMKVSKEDISFLIKNEGNVLEGEKKGGFLIKNRDGHLIKRIEFIVHSLFPGEDEEIKIKTPLLPRNEYRVEIEIDGRVIQEEHLWI